MAGLFAALMLADSAPARALSKPPRLRPGDVVGLIEPASFSDGPDQIELVKHTIAGMGLVPKVGAHVSARYGYLAGTDEQRASDINAMFADDEVRAIFAVRGGWGCARLLPLLDWKVIRANPKLLIGSSDITALHLAIAARTDFASIHAPNAASRWQAISWESFWRLAFAGDTPTFDQPDMAAGDPTMQDRWRTTTIHPVKATGRLLGGNLSVLTALVGTP